MSARLLPREQYCGDIKTPVLSLSSNAKAWRALYDLAPILDELGDHAEAARLRAVAAAFKARIVAALEPKELGDLYDLARGLDLDVLVEIHDEDDLECALEVVDADVIGINNRDLTDFTVDIQRTFDLLADVPAGKTVVSESGIADALQLARLQEAGVAGVLVGESLMRAPVPEKALLALRKTPPRGAPAGVDRTARSFS